jgi:Ion channel
MPGMSPPISRNSEWRDRRERFGLLLGAITATFAVQGIGSPGVLADVLVTALLAGTLLLALWAADAKPRVMRPAAIVALGILALSIGEAIAGNSGGSAVRVANVLLVVLAPPAVIVGVLRSVRARNKVTVPAVLAVLCLYILLGLFFAQLYATIDRVHGGFFANDATGTPAHFLYFSFVTLTTVGYGDYIAAGNLGHTLAVSEALVGQIYLVTIVSLLVSNLGRPRGVEQ